MEHLRDRAARPGRGRKNRPRHLAFLLGGMALAVLASAVVSRAQLLSSGGAAVEAGRPLPHLRSLRSSPVTSPVPVALPGPAPRPTTTAPPLPSQPVTPTTDPPAPPRAAGGAGAGVTPGAAFEEKFVSMTSQAQQAVISQMKGAGVQWLRLDVPADYRFDTFVRDATSDGINVDAVIQDWTTPDTASAFSSFSTQAVHTLKPLGVETYEILNEPNGCADSMTAGQYTAILKSSYQAIKAADPSATVLSAGMCPNGGSNEPYNYLTAMYQAGAGGYFDAFNMHPYSYPDTPLQTDDSWNPWSYLPELHSIMAANGDGNKKIWLTEFGCPTGAAAGYSAVCSDSSLSTQITDAFDQADGWSWAGPLMVYDWQDDPNSGGGDFGLYQSDGAPKTDTLAAYERAAAG